MRRSADVTAAREAGIGRWTPLVLALALTGLWGCSGQPPPPPTVPVSGTVTYNGKPLTQGSVIFQPAQVLGKGEGEAAVRRPAQGTIGPDGTYRLSTFSEGDGVMPGEYHVVVVSYADEPTPEEYAEGATRKSAIPEKYSSGQTSGLTQQIPADRSEPIEYNIKLVD